LLKLKQSGESEEEMEFDQSDRSKNDLFLEKCEVKYSSNVVNREKKKKEEPTLECCVICLENDSNAVILNCGHGGLCHDCGKRLLQKVQLD
jgi:hypothetical protein